MPTQWFVAPPWSVCSPSGVWYYVQDEEMLRLLAKEQGVKPSNFTQLVGLTKNTSPGLPQHKAKWQLRQKIW